MQIQMLDTVYTESKRVPIRTKPKFEILKPEFTLSGEHFIEPTPLRCHLVPDGREELSGLSSGTVLLPAEGALFLTNYRLIYRGIPINDSLMSDAIITRSFPISSMIKEKKIGNQHRMASASNSLSSTTLPSSIRATEFASLHDGLQIRSSTFQLIKVFFDEEVTTDKIEKFRHILLKLRYPQSVFDFFCFNQTNNVMRRNLNVNFNVDNQCETAFPRDATKQFNGSTGANSHPNPNASDYYAPTLSLKSKENHADAIKHFAKNTLRKAGLMPRNNNRKLPQTSQSHLVSAMASRTPETVRKATREFALNDADANMKNSIDNDEESLSSKYSIIHNFKMVLLRFV